MSRRLSSSCCALLAALVLAPGAWAQGAEEDPQVDPQSPAGTEYQLPSERAREEARGPGGDKSGGSPERQAPLFGEGLSADEQGGSASGESTSGSTSGGSTAGTGASQREGDADKRGANESKPQELRAEASTPDGGGGSLLAIGGAATGVLLVGGLVGLILRRRSAPG